MNAHSNIEAIRSTAELIREMLGEDFDDQTFFDTLDGETDVMDMFGHMVRVRIEALAHEEANKSIAATYRARAERCRAKADAMSQGIGALMDAIGEAKVVHPTATLSRRKAQPLLDIQDEDAVPRQLCKFKPDGIAIKSLLLAGEKVPGAALKMGQPGLQVRVK